MSIYLSGPTSIAALITAKIGMTVTEDQLLLGPVTLPTPTELTRFGKNTKVNVRAVEGIEGLEGRSDVFYDRTQLEPLALASAVGADVTGASTLEQVLEQIKKCIGANILVEDVDMTAISADPVTEVVTVTLVAKPTSYGWLGSVTMRLRVRPHISEYFKITALPGF